MLDNSYLNAIKKFEGYTSKPFWDYKQYTSGYGTKAQPGDANLSPEELKKAHEERFLNEIGNAEDSVNKILPENTPPGIKAALTSLTYNAGPGWINAGLGDAVKRGDWDNARNLFLQYNKAGGDVNQGLLARRQQESTWFDGTAPGTTQEASANSAAPSTPTGNPSASNTPAPNNTLVAALAQKLNMPMFNGQSQAMPTVNPASLFAQMAPQAQAAPIQFAQDITAPVSLDALRMQLARGNRPIFTSQG